MNESLIERLTDGQRACLRLVLEHKQTKQIARELGIAPDTVKQRLRFAMRTLGVDTRVQAAILLRQHDEAMHPRGVYPSPALADVGSAAAGTDAPVETPVEKKADEADAATGVVETAGSADETRRGAARTEIAHALTIPMLLAAFAARLGVDKAEPAGAGAGNRLPPVQRILLIILIAIGSVLSITGLVSAARELALLRR